MTPVVTVFADRHGKSINAVREMDLAEVERVIRVAPAAATKDKLALLKFATFGNVKSEKDSLRHDRNVLTVTGVEGDYDGEQTPMADAVAKLSNVGVAALFYTSASHTTERPRWRVLCPLSAALTGTEVELRQSRQRYTGVLNAILGGVLKSESFALSQCFYFGPIKGRPKPEIVRLEGACIDQLPNPPAPVFPAKGAAAQAATAASIKDRSDSADLLKRVSRAYEETTDRKVIYDKFKTHPHVLRQDDQERAIDRAIEKVERDRAAVLAHMNSQHAVVSWKGKTLILSEKMDHHVKRLGFELSSFGDFNNLYSNQFVGKQTRSQWWLRQAERRQFDSVGFVPGEEIAGMYNFWRGFGVQPQAGDCSLYLNMVEQVICSGDQKLNRYVLAWLADAVQRPGKKPGVVLVAKGTQGAGKGTFAREFGALFGAHFLHLTHAGHLTGRFNAHLANTLLLFADECFWAGDKQGEGVLKGLVTEPTVSIEYKGKDVISVPNYVRIVMASNKDWVVPAALDDRRFCVIDVSDKHAKDSDYFGAIHNQLRSGGTAALLDYLLKYDLGGVDLRKIPETAARTEQQLRSMDTATAFWFSRLNNGSQLATESEWAEEVVTGELYTEFAQDARVSGEHRRGHETAFGIQLKKMCPGICKADVLRSDGGGESKRMKVYRFPGLEECRRAFEAFAGRTFDWDTATGAVKRGWSGGSSGGDGADM